MNRIIIALAFGASTPLGALAAGPSGNDAPANLPQVTATAPVELQYGCRAQMWPTQRQVERYTQASAEAAARMRTQIVSEGRRLCVQGYTDVQVQFSASRRDVAMIGR